MPGTASPPNGPTSPGSPAAPSGGPTIERPVFPLQTVLFPGGSLPLRIFETRYVDMVRACLREDSSFVVARITRGEEVGAAAEHESIGTLATIAHWDMAPGGLLHILVEGRQRVRLSSRRIDNGLVRARAEPLPEEADQAVPAHFEPAARITREICTRMFDEPAQGSSGGADVGADRTAGSDGTTRITDGTAARALPGPWRFDSATWVGRRLCEWLPLADQQRQQMLILNDPIERLERLWPVLIEQGWLGALGDSSTGS